MVKERFTVAAVPATATSETGALPMVGARLSTVTGLVTVEPFPSTSATFTEMVRAIAAGEPGRSLPCSAYE